jgi:hypothetical protein
VYRVEHVARLRVPSQAGARTEREQLRTLDARELVGQQDQASRGIGDAELAHLGELDESANVENRDVGTMRTQDHRDPPLLDVLGHDRKAVISAEKLAQAPGEQVVKAPDDDGDGRCWRG